ncbi:MAG: glycosyltransferase family 1 protein [Beijerinckiaceae bacterium]|nr:glycosyltransferase family 1 protein [Beijerinckiaceae bacterium]
MPHAYRPIVYNVAPLLLAARAPALRGVERVDFGCISYLLDHWPADVVGLLPTVFGMRFYSRERIQAARRRLIGLWREEGDRASDPVYELVADALLGKVSAPPRPSRRVDVSKAIPMPRGWGRVVDLLFSDGFGLGTAVDEAPQHALYLDIGHMGIVRSAMLGWLRRRPDIDPIFMVHDAIPFEAPELLHPRAVRLQRKVFKLVARFASGVIVPCEAMNAPVGKHLYRYGERNIPVRAIPLPIDGHFSREVQPDPVLAKVPFLVACGVLERRKNQLFLLHVWRELIARLGPEAPYLVLAGRKGFGSEELLDQLQRSEVLRDRVVLAKGLSSASLARLMASARGVLMPSFTEGFGLPPIEALSVGTPVILSDIPAHRDAAGPYGMFLHPLDAPAWIEAIESLLSDEQLATRRQAIDGFTTRRWPDYMSDFNQVLQEFSNS